MTEPSNIVPFPQTQIEGQEWVVEYQQTCLVKHDEATIDAYRRILHQFMEWVAKRPGHAKQFHPEQLTATSVEMYLSSLKEQGYSISHRTRVKSVIKHFCQWLIDEKEVLKRNPASGIEIKAQQVLAPRILSPDQRFVFRNLIEKAGDLRGQAIFALGYWAGCRVSNVAHLLMEHTMSARKLVVSMLDTKERNTGTLTYSMRQGGPYMTISSMVDATRRVLTSLPRSVVYISLRMGSIIGFVLSNARRIKTNGNLSLTSVSMTYGTTSRIAHEKPDGRLKKWLIILGMSR